MPALYLVQQGSKVRIHKGRLQVEKEENGGVQVLAALPLGHVSELVLFGNIGLTTPAIGLLLDKNIKVVFLSQRGEYRGELSSGLTPHVPLRKAQYALLGEGPFGLEMAKGFVRAKLEHQRALLQRHNRPRGDAAIQGAVEQISAALKKLPTKTKVSSLRGLEGAASAAYFGGFKKLFGEEWHFEKRQRRPPPDPVNALLSFGYTLLAQTCSGAVQAVGLDPYAGFLHELVYNRPALGLDLMEEFRPVLDGLVLWCCNSGQISPDDFEIGLEETPEGEEGLPGARLCEAGKRNYLKAFEERFSRSFTHPITGQKLPLRQCIHEQARQVRRCIESAEPQYRGMGFR